MRELTTVLSLRLPSRPLTTAAQEQALGRQVSSIPTGVDATKCDDRPRRSDGFLQRFLKNLRVALAVPHI